MYEKMNSCAEESILTDYFYPEHSMSKFNKWVCLIGLITIPIGIGMAILLLWLLVRIVMAIIRMFGNTSAQDYAYDKVVKEDISFIKDRAVNVMGMVEEELSLIDPLVLAGFGNSDSIKYGVFIEKKQNIFKEIISWIKAIFNDQVVSEVRYCEGEDKNIRCSVRSVVYIAFTEEQVCYYECNYDVALRVILEEYVGEIFYRDIDCVAYGDETLHVWSENNKKYTLSTVRRLQLNVPSGHAIQAGSIGESDMLENQVVAAKNLIRSKKMTMA